MAIDHLGENDDETITLNNLYDVMNIKGGLTYDDIYSKSVIYETKIDRSLWRKGVHHHHSTGEKHWHTNIKPQKSHARDTRGSKTVENMDYWIGFICKYIRTESNT